MERGLPDERLVFVDLETAGVEPTRPTIQIAAIAVSSDIAVSHVLGCRRGGWSR